MEFAFTEEQAMIAETVQGFFADHATSERTRAAMNTGGLDKALWSAFCSDLGLGGIAVDEKFGGSGLGMVEFAIVAEAAGARIAALPLLSLAMAARALEHGGTESQKSEWLPKLISGEIIAAAAGAASANFSDGKLSGEFEFVPHGGIADLYLVATRDGAWIVNRNSDGVSVETFTTLDQTRPFAHVTLSDAEADPIADHEKGLAAANAGGWLCLAAEALGGAQATLERTCDYARERIQFGRPIGSFQAYKHRLADMMVDIEQARSAVYWAACSLDENAEDAQLSLHAAKSFCTDIYFKCASDMIQLHGGIGFTWEHDAHLYFKRAKAIQEMLRNSEWHREEIARMILGDAA